VTPKGRANMEGCGSSCVGEDAKIMALGRLDELAKRPFGRIVEGAFSSGLLLHVR